MRLRPSPRLLIAGLMALALGCEGRTSGFLTTGPTNNVRVRLINALTSSQSLDLVLDAQVAASGVGFGTASQYASTSEGTHQLQARASGVGTTLVDLTRSLTTGAFSFVLAPGLGQSGALVLTDDPTSTAGQSRIRVVHVAAAPGAISVYITAPTADLTSATPVVPNLAFASASPYVGVNAGTYRIRITRAGSPGDVLADLSNTTLGGGTVKTVLVTDASGGGLPPVVSIISDN
jgi:hypothetical protein